MYPSHRGFIQVKMSNLPLGFSGSFLDAMVSSLSLEAKCSRKAFNGAEAIANFTDEEAAIRFFLCFDGSSFGGVNIVALLDGSPEAGPIIHSRYPDAGHSSRDYIMAGPSCAPVGVVQQPVVPLTRRVAATTYPALLPHASSGGTFGYSAMMGFSSSYDVMAMHQQQLAERCCLLCVE